MTAPTPEPKEPEPRGAIDEILNNLHVWDWHEMPLEQLFKLQLDAGIQLAALRSSLAEAVKRAEVAEGENERLTEFMRRAQGQLAAALIAPSAKLETDAQPEKLTP